MQDEPSGVSAEALAAVLRDRWGFPVTGLTYEPVGFGDYHWTAEGLDGERWFITVCMAFSNSAEADCLST